MKRNARGTNHRHRCFFSTLLGHILMWTAKCTQNMVQNVAKCDGGFKPFRLLQMMSKGIWLMEERSRDKFWMFIWDSTYQQKHQFNLVGDDHSSFPSLRGGILKFKGSAGGKTRQARNFLFTNQNALNYASLASFCVRGTERFLDSCLLFMTVWEGAVEVLTFNAKLWAKQKILHLQYECLYIKENRSWQIIKQLPYQNTIH